MTDKAPPQRTMDRKKRQAEALKANMKKRKEQAKLLAQAHIATDNDEEQNG